jgi:hypothetical protein
VVSEHLFLHCIPNGTPTSLRCRKTAQEAEAAKPRLLCLRRPLDVSRFAVQNSSKTTSVSATTTTHLATATVVLADEINI